MASITPARTGQSRRVQSAVSLIWVHQRSVLYRRIGNIVLREVSRYLQAPPALLMHITQSKVRVFSFADESWSREVTLSQLLKDIEYAKATPISESQMLLCGGAQSKADKLLRAAYQISVTGAVAVLPEMLHGRCAHGLIAYQRTAYVFGGNETGYTSLKSGEQLSLTNSQWETLPDMGAGRSNFYPAVYHAQIYLCGGSPLTMDVFDPTTRTMSLVPLTLGGSFNCLVFVRNDELCIVNTEWIGAVKLQGSELKLVRGRRRSSPWPESKCTPVLYGDCLYYVGNQTLHKSYFRDR